MSLLFSLTASSMAKDYESAHKVSAGDVISADIINELFDEIANFRKTLTENDLIGTWKGEAYGVFSNMDGNQAQDLSPILHLTNV